MNIFTDNREAERPEGAKKGRGREERRGQTDRQWSGHQARDRGAQREQGRKAGRGADQLSTYCVLRFVCVTTTRLFLNVEVADGIGATVPLRACGAQSRCWAEVHTCG